MSRKYDNMDSYAGFHGLDDGWDRGHSTSDGAFQTHFAKIFASSPGLLRLTFLPKRTAIDGIQNASAKTRGKFYGLLLGIGSRGHSMSLIRIRTGSNEDAITNACSRGTLQSIGLALDELSSCSDLERLLHQTSMRSQLRSTLRQLRCNSMIKDHFGMYI